MHGCELYSRFVSKRLYDMRKNGHGPPPKPRDSEGQAVSYRMFRSSSPTASRLARYASKKRGTKCELAMSRALRKLHLSFSSNVRDVDGCPDFVFRSKRTAVFVDGDFWHGRNMAIRLKRLAVGSNGAYWTKKIKSNVRRDTRVRSRLRRHGWSVLRVWESDVHADADRVARGIRLRLSRRALRSAALIPSKGM
jgi:DNA mismatch endonuclease (patch repair protein)